jgi:hypothetical protein
VLQLAGCAFGQFAACRREPPRPGPRASGDHGGEGLTYREARHPSGVFPNDHRPARVVGAPGPDIQKVVARLTTTTASEPIDRKKLEWVAEPVKWPEQRARFQKVMDEAFGAEPAPIAPTLGHVLKLRDDLRAKRTTMKRVAAARETSVEELREYLGLAKLAPVVRDQVLGMTTMTVNELVTEEKLRFIARERNHVEQRRMYERLLAGQLRCTRAEARRAAVMGNRGFWLQLQRSRSRRRRRWRPPASPPRRSGSLGGCVQRGPKQRALSGSPRRPDSRVFDFPTHGRATLQVRRLRAGSPPPV